MEQLRRPRCARFRMPEVPNENRQPVSGRLLFSFFVIADTHVNEGENASTSPYRTNLEANPRARQVFAELAAARPRARFVVHLGDMVHPVPALSEHKAAIEQFRSLASLLDVPLRLTPGNHDVGDKSIEWMPAGRVCEDYLATYREAFGPDYYGFEEDGVLFIVLNSLLLNSGLPDEARQRIRVERQLDGAAGKRVFLFMHYPPFLFSPDEEGNYDNIDEPARTWLLNQIGRQEVEAAFSGHVHNFWLHCWGSAKLYALPSTAFVRQDFAEFCASDPGPEFGRNDTGKLGYFKVDVFEGGHVASLVRTWGRTCAPKQIPEAGTEQLIAHPSTSGFNSFGVELRHPWAEVVQIPSTGGVQEFGRKRARNDYTLLALLEMGAKLSKVPDADLLDPSTRARMRLMAEFGHRFIATSLGVPSDELVSAATEFGDGVFALEVNLTLREFNRARDMLRSIQKQSGVRLYLSVIEGGLDDRVAGSTFSHAIKAGFTPEQAERKMEFISEAVAEGVIDGVTVRLERSESLPAASHRLGALCSKARCRILASLKLHGAAADRWTDDRETAARAAQAMVLSRFENGVWFIFDTFMDVDRGFYPRNAFIDRRFNPRAAARACKRLSALFPEREPFVASEGSSTEEIPFKHSNRKHLLVCAPRTRAVALLESLPGDTGVQDLIAEQSGSGSSLRNWLAKISFSDREKYEAVLAYLD